MRVEKAMLLIYRSRAKRMPSPALAHWLTPESRGTCKGRAQSDGKPQTSGVSSTPAGVPPRLQVEDQERKSASEKSLAHFLFSDLELK